MSVLGVNHLLSGIVEPPAKSSPQPWKWSAEEYYKLGECGFFQGKRVELIRGEILEMSPIGWSHALATGLVAEVLARVFSTSHFINEEKPLALSGSSPGTEPQPDVAVVPGSRRNYASHPGTAALIVEVADTTLAYDTTTKAELYATAGILDYWVLDLEGKRLLIFRDPVQLPAGLEASAYRKHISLGPTDTIAPLEAPNCDVTVSDLLP